jgi:tetratricopeptide (TPR) repeat protein/transcriptional regulator with XRE-family HTH domain
MFGELVRTYRLRSGMSRHRLAVATGLGLSTLRDVERGRIGRPRPSTVRLLAEAFELAGAERERFQWAALGVVVTDQVAVRAEPAVPVLLPPEAFGFAGRREPLTHLDAILTDAPVTTGHGPPAPTTMAIAVISGMAGVGKTALAVHWAHRVAHLFPGGQLYVDLHGFGPGRTADPGEVIGSLLQALGAALDRIPDRPVAQTALYRSLLAGKRVLIVLDNARDAEQVRPLLPGSATCRVVVTSRDQLTSLIAVEGAHPVSLNVLSFDEAREFLALRLDRGLSGDDLDAADDVITACARLPLALGIAAARLRQTGFSLSVIAAELDNAAQALDALDGGDPTTRLRTVFAHSYTALAPATARLFRMLGLHPGSEYATPTVAGLAAHPIDRTRSLLADLTRANLLTEHSPGRFRMHDLLRAYAISLADGDDPAERRTTRTRLFDHYLAMSVAAIRHLYPADTAHESVPPPSTGPGSPLPDAETARAWLDAERESLVAVIGHAARHGWPDHALRLSRTLARYLAGGHRTAAVRVHTHARDAARLLADPAAEARALTDLGLVQLRLGDYSTAAGYCQQAVDLFAETGDGQGAASARHIIGIAEERLGRYETAATYYQAALTVFEEAGDLISAARTTANLGLIALRRRRLSSAVALFQQALKISQRAGDLGVEGRIRTFLGQADIQLDRPDTAIRQLDQALAIARLLGDQEAESWALADLGNAHRALGEVRQAVDYLTNALVITRECGDRDIEAWILNGLGEASKPSHAIAHHRAALAIAVEIGVLDQQARAHTGLGDGYRALGNTDLARRHLADALVIRQRLGVDAGQ